jgi:hypothetical protein
MLKLPTTLLLAIFAIGLSLLAGCGVAATSEQTGGGLSASGRKVALGEAFKLEKEEKVLVEGANLTVELKGVRRTWYVDGKSETADADIIMTLDGKEQRHWIKVGEEVAVGSYRVKLSGADPFGKTSATLVVSSSNALLFSSPSRYAAAHADVS